MNAGFLLAVAVAYLGALFVLASAVDRSTGFARNIAHAPGTHALALGIFSTSWGFFGTVGFAASEGYRFLALQVGATISWALVPWIWAPLSRLCREHQFATLADLLAYRYHSRSVGALIAVFFLAGSLPYQALQLEAVVESVRVLSQAQSRGPAAEVVTLLLIAFALLYGVRHVMPLERHDGFVAALAIESLVKLLAMLIIAGYALFWILGGLHGVEQFLADHPAAKTMLVAPARQRSWFAVLLLSGTSVFLLPRQWHLAFTQGEDAHLRTASWALPTYQFLLYLCVPPLLWAGQKLGLPGSPDFYVLGVSRASGSAWLSTAVFLGALSASAAMIVVSTVALAIMVQNQIVLPLTPLRGGNLYVRLQWLKRALVALIILAGHGVYLLLANRTSLTEIGLTALLAVAQALPGLFGVLLWSRATARGVICGLCAGIVAWIATPVVPLLASVGALPVSWNWLTALDLSSDPWSFNVALSLGVNVLCFVAGSFARSATRDELRAAAICRGRNELLPEAGVEALSVHEFEQRLRPVLGQAATTAELNKALEQLDMTIEATDPEALQRLRRQLETNLSGLLGPVTARIIVDERLALDDSIRSLVSRQLIYVEERLSALELEGPARAVESVRKFLRDALDEAPLGVCALDAAGEIVLWNRALAELTTIDAQAALRRSISTLPSPWCETLVRFVHSGAKWKEIEVKVVGHKHTLALHRSAFGEADNVLMLIEDRTEELALRAKIEHQNRLEQLGLFAAGTAHEIRSPLTAISLFLESLLGRESLDAKTRPRAEVSLREVRWIGRIVEDMLAFARVGDGRGPVVVAEAIEHALTRVRTLVDGQRIAFVPELEPDLVLEGSRQRLEQVLTNLLMNANDASQPGGAVRVTAARIASGVRLEVIDQGCGMPPALCARAFEPFVTTKPAGRGTGLGLFLVRGIVEDHGGTVSIASTEGRGTRVTIELPT